MGAVITPEPPDSADASALIGELEDHLAAFYPRESRHGYSVEKLIARAVAFFVVRADGVAAGCGGVELFGPQYAELKRMYVRPGFRGLGLGRRMLDHLGCTKRADFSRFRRSASTARTRSACSTNGGSRPRLR